MFIQSELLYLLRSKSAYIQVFILMFQPHYSLAEDWRLVREANDIKIYSKAVDGSALNAVRGVTVVNTDIKRLVTLLRDPSLRPQWDKYCGESYLYKVISSNEELVYLHSKMPWPVSDRDVLNRVTWLSNNETGIITMTAIATSDLFPQKEGRVRVVHAYNKWQLRPLGDGLVELVTIAHVDPAGPLPSWLINTLSVESPYNILNRLRALAQEVEITTYPVSTEL